MVVDAAVSSWRKQEGLLKATFKEMLMNVRRNLAARDHARVQKARRFCVHLVDPLLTREKTLVAPEYFAGVYDVVVRPLLDRATRCDVFYRLTQPALGGRVDRASEETITARGGDPEHWRARYLGAATAGRAPLQLSGAVLDDRLFWWWLLMRPSGLWPVFVLPIKRLNPALLFGETYDPHFAKWSFAPRSAAMKAFRFAKDETAGGEAVAVMKVRPTGFELAARAADAGRLFSAAAAHCRISERRWAQR